jgi:hypothetical protein
MIDKRVAGTSFHQQNQGFLPANFLSTMRYPNRSIYAMIVLKYKTGRTIRHRALRNSVISALDWSFLPRSTRRIACSKADSNHFKVI